MKISSNFIFDHEKLADLLYFDVSQFSCWFYFDSTCGRFMFAENLHLSFNVEHLIPPIGNILFCEYTIDTKDTKELNLRYLILLVNTKNYVVFTLHVRGSPL